MRVLDRESIRLSLPDMGFSEDTLARYQTLLAKPHGVLLVTGPTGSGKTTTLYASLASWIPIASRSLQWKIRWSISCRGQPDSGSIPD